MVGVDVVGVVVLVVGGAGVVGVGVGGSNLLRNQLMILTKNWRVTTPMPCTLDGETFTLWELINTTSGIWFRKS